MKDESSKRFSKLRAFAKDAFSSQEYNDNDFYSDDEDSYEKAGSSKADDAFEETEKRSYAYQSTYSSPYSFDTERSSSFSSSGSAGYSAHSDNSGKSTIYKMNSKTKFRLSILRLEKLDDAVKVADEIMSGNTITLVDLRCVQKETVRRIIDFLDGVRYTCEAKMEIVADYTYVVVPKDVELSGDLFSQIETGSLS